jgi:hypothetical protein
MREMIVQMEIPNPPDGWVFIGVRSIGNDGELYWDGWKWRESCITIRGKFPVAVMTDSEKERRKQFTPSKELEQVLESGWICRDRFGVWWWYRQKPEVSKTKWMAEGDRMRLVGFRCGQLPTSYSDWHQSLVQIGVGR